MQTVISEAFELTVGSYTNCLIAVLNNRRLGPNGTLTTFQTGAADSSQTPRTQGTGSIDQRDQGLRIKVVRDVDYCRDSDVELGNVNVC